MYIYCAVLSIIAIYVVLSCAVCVVLIVLSDVLTINYYNYAKRGGADRLARNNLMKLQLANLSSTLRTFCKFTGLIFFLIMMLKIDILKESQLNTHTLFILMYTTWY